MMHKRNYNHDLVHFIPGIKGWFNIKSIIIIHHINNLKKTHMATEKAFDKTNTHS